MKNLEEHLLKWLQLQEFDSSNPWMLAVSGGCDSMALLHAMAALYSRGLQDLLAAKIVVLHFDHGWRQESASEAKEVEKQVQVLASTGVPIEVVIERSKKGALASNLEESARNERYQFFERWQKKIKSRYLFLAHHVDDLYETLLKNIFEGKELFFLHGMREIGQRADMTLARPFLKLPKLALSTYVEEKGGFFVDDKTNADSRFLRARIRKELIPVLDRVWDKNWREGLLQVHSYSKKRLEEMQQKIDAADLVPTKIVGGLMWRIPQGLLESELRYFLRNCSQGIEPLERSGSHNLAKAYLEKALGFKYRSKSYLWKIRKDHLLALKANFNPSVDSSAFSWKSNFLIPDFFQGCLTWGPWRITLGTNRGLGSLLLGSFSTTFHYEWTHLNLIETGEVRKKVLRHMQRQNVAAHLRPYLPLLAHEPEKIELSKPSERKLLWTWAFD